MRRYLYNIITGKPKDPIGYLIRVIFVFLSLFFLLGVKLRLFLYKVRILKSHKLKTPVISIGNLTWGGTGKTPLTEYLCTYFTDKGNKLAILTRGYGKDEHLLLSENMPNVSVLVGKNRRKNALSKEQDEDIGLFVLDDGFGHIKLKRDIDIVAINANDPFGTGMLIPAGSLREPLSSLSRVDIVVITKSDIAPKEKIDKIRDIVSKINTDTEIFEAIHTPVCIENNGEDKLLHFIKDKEVCIVSGLGDNLSFQKTIDNIGANAKLRFSFMDHHPYKKEDIIKIVDSCKGHKIDYIITTQKDWVKIKPLVDEAISKNVEFLVLKMRMSIDERENFFHRISDSISG